jgi:hypothetical protein
MPTVTSRIGGTPMRLVAELLARPTTDESCCVPSPQSPVSGPVARWAANEMRFCVHALRALVGCSLDGSEMENWIVCGCLKCILGSRPGMRRFRYERHSSSFSLLSLGHPLGAVPAPGGASMFCFVRCGERPSGLGFQQQISRAENKNTLEISCRSLRRKHISALGAGHLTSLRARVSRGSSGQKPTWRKSSWHSTKTASA